MNKPLLTIVAGLVLAQFSTGALAQQAAQGQWSGWARCQVSVQGPGYSDQQTHTWTITAGAPTTEGAFQVYAATWSVTGSGSLTRSQGNQSLTAQWATNGPAVSAPVAVFVRASDRRMFIQSRHAQLRSTGAVQGFQRQTIAGVPQKPADIRAEAFEWAFPLIAVSAPVAPETNATANGSSTSPTNGSVGVMQPGGSQGTASCTWQFGQGAAAPAPPVTLAAQPVPTAGGPVTTSPPSDTPPANNPPVDSAPVASIPSPTSPSVSTSPAASLEPPILSTMPLDPGLVAIPELCTLRPPGISGASNYSTPASVHLFWGVVGGATGYKVSRSDRGLLTTPALSAQATNFVDRVSPTSAAYSYTITAIYPQGCGARTVSVSPRPPKTPSPGAILGTQPGQVRLVWSWRSSEDSRFYDDYAGVLITGPTFPSAGRDVLRSGTSSNGIFLVGVPAGTQTWRIKAYWNTPGGRVMDNIGKTVSVNVP